MAIKYRSNFEKVMADKVSYLGVEYEAFKVPYIIPESYHTYTPDFTISNDYEDLWVEMKGCLTLQDQKKHKLLRSQYPNQLIVFVFMNENVKIRKGSKTTYRMWAEKNDYEVVKPKDLERYIINFINRK